MDELRRRALSLRARVYGLIRAFFAQRAVIEVDTPILGQGASTDVHIRSFDTGGLGWLRIPVQTPVGAGVPLNLGVGFGGIRLSGSNV